MRAREAFEQPAALLRLVLVEGRVFQVLDIERDAVTAGQHQNDRTDERECDPEGIAQQLHGLAPGIGPEPSRIESLGSARCSRYLRRCRGFLRRCRGLEWRGLLFLLGSAGFLQIRNESILKRSAAALLDEVRGRADGEHLARMHQRDAVAALGLVHEVGREEDGHAVVTRKIDQRAPERVAGDRIDTRGWLVENEHGRSVQHGHRKLQPLLHAKRQALRLGVGYLSEIISFQQLTDAALNLICREMIKVCVQLKILPDGKLAVERERLRHVADVLACLHVVGGHRLPK